MRARQHSPLVQLYLGNIGQSARRLHDLPRTQRGHRATRAGVMLHRDGATGEQDDDHPQSTLPPLTLRISPVTCRASAEHRNTIGPAMSSAEAMRPSGMLADIFVRPSLAIGATTISVSTHPGATEFHVMPCGASSVVSDLVNQMTAPF